MNTTRADQTCVAVLAGKALRPGLTVFDVAAGDGAWTAAALAAVPALTVDCFEADPARYRQLLRNLGPAIAAGQVVPHQAAIGPAAGGAPWASLADYARPAGLGRLPFVRVGPASAAAGVLVGCDDLVRHGHVEFLLATADAAAEATLAARLVPHRYELFRHGGLGDQVLCVSDRFRSTVKGEAPRMPDVVALCQEFGIAPRGVVHVGAHEGHEAKRYRAGSFAKVLMVEANPAVYARLGANVAGLDGVVTVNCAAGDRNGTADLRVTNLDQSSSILPLARHGVVYPGIRQAAVVTVPLRTVDQILLDVGHAAADYNLLKLDIQGAELMALKGCPGLLPHVEAVLVEVNYEELYAGCPPIEAMDAFLEGQGFERVVTTTPHHSSCADAFYVRRRPAAAAVTAEFLYGSRNALVSGWLGLPRSAVREAWEGATGNAHRHLIAHGVCRLPPASGSDERVLASLTSGLGTAGTDQRLQVLLALVLYLPIEQIAVPTGGVPGWLAKAIGGRGAGPSQAA